MAIETFESAYPHIKGDLPGSLFYLEHRRRKDKLEGWKLLRDNTPPVRGPAGNKSPEFTLKAFINHGRWLVRCPCGNAQKASESVRWFYCCACLNRGTQPPHMRIRVEWPEPKERAAIEAILNLRPDKAFQHWLPGESIKKLKAENRRANLPLPEGV